MNDVKKNTAGIPTNQKLSWTAPEGAYYQKNKSWYIAIVILALLFGTLFVYLKMYSGAAVVVAAVLALFSQANLKPKEVEYALDESGLHYQEKTISLNKFKAFWITPTPKLYLLRTGRLTLPLTIYLKGINPAIVRNFLAQHLPEETNKGELVHENINKLFRF